MMSYGDNEQQSKIPDRTDITNSTSQNDLEDGEEPVEEISTKSDIKEAPTELFYKQRTFVPSRKNNRYNNNNNNKRVNIWKTSHIKQTPTLLQKLLSKEIQQENNIILQCFRYFVNQNFFLRRY